MTAAPNYAELCRVCSRIYRYNHLAAIVGWDRDAMMPPKGNEARAAAEAEMDALMHRMRTEPRLAALLRAAEDEPLDDVAARQPARDAARLARRERAARGAGRGADARGRRAASTRGAAQRPANDWAGFLAEPARGGARSRARRRSCSPTTRGLSRYDALMDRFEPGMRARRHRPRVRRRQAVAAGSDRARARRSRRSETVIAPVGPFPVAAQRALCRAVMKLLGFDFDGGRLDESTHPFSGGVPEDVRLTTRYREDDFAQSLMGTIHETGHARYEQNLPRELARPAGRRGALDGIHESQSLSFEMQLGAQPRLRRRCSRRCCAAHFGEQPAFEPDNLHRLLTRVQPGLIRVDADEVTYPAHVILRYEIERALIEGEIEVDDIPALWDEKMKALLGVDTRGNFNDGCMQDVHWTEGAVRLLPVLHAGRDVRGAVVRHDAPRDAGPRRADRARRSGAGVRLAAREHLVAGEPLGHAGARARAPAARRSTRALPRAPRDALSRRSPS